MPARSDVTRVPNRIDRRQVMVGTAAAGLATAFAMKPARASANDRVHVCIIGVRGRGQGLGKSFAAQSDVQVTHICDVNEPLLDGYATQIEEVQESAPKKVVDLRRVLDDKSVDAIVVATPDHWHALATIWGCQAGKHVYVEKPISNNVFEGRQMIAAARKYKKTVQVGTQSRSAPHYREIMELLGKGLIGKVHMAKAWNSQLRRKVPAVPDSSIPAGLDWNVWQGPAPERPFNSNRYTYGWRWLWDYGTGDMGNDGVHDLDIARWGLGVGMPTEINCTGDKLVFAGDIQETPDTQFVTFKFPDQQAVLVYEQRLWSPYFQEGYENGVAFYGTEGYVVVGRQGWKHVEKRNKVVREEKTSFSEVPHVQNFIASLKSGETPNCDIEEGYKSTLLAHLGNISYRVARPLKFDTKQHTILDDDKAAAMLKRAGRKEFVIPEEV